MEDEAETQQEPTPVAVAMARASGGRDWRLFNIIAIGLAFMFLFTAFQTCAMVEESVLESAVEESNSTFSGNGYTSLAIIYGVFSVANWGAPSVVSVCGPKISLMIGALFYCVFIASFLKPMTWALYLGSVLVGIGAAVIWTAQGNFLTINSDLDTVGRNSGIFWALLQCSLLFGNLYVYFAFKGEINITAESRTTVFIVLTVVSVVGLLLFLILRSKPRTDTENGQGGSHCSHTHVGPLQALVQSGRIFVTKRMLLLSVTFAYTGFELTFFSGVYGTSVGHNQHFGDEAKSLIGLCGIFIGVGEILGGALFGLMGKKTNKYGRDPIVMFGYVVHMLCFYLIFINQPMDSPIKDSSGTYITANKYLAILCAFLLGLGDSSFNTQVYSLLGMAYENESAPAFALFKFIQSLTAAAGFFYSNHLTLQWQLLILVVLGTVGSMTFSVVEWEVTDKQKGYDRI